MAFTKEVKFKTSSKTKSYSRKSEKETTTYRNKGLMSPRINLEQGWQMKNDFIRHRYLDELVRDAYKYHFANDDTGWNQNLVSQYERPRSRSADYFPKDRVRLRNGRIERIPVDQSSRCNKSNKEQLVPIRYLGGEYRVSNKASNFSTAVLPKRNPRDTLSHRGNFLHFIT